MLGTSTEGTCREFVNFNGPVLGNCLASIPLQARPGDFDNVIFEFIVNGSAESRYIPLTYNLAAYVNALDTAFISGIDVFDADGKLETNVRLYSESGTNYNANRTAVTPEPSSLILVVTGLVGTISTLRKRLT
jgi:hypothetical protein